MRHRCQSKMNNNGRMNGLPGFYFLLQPSKTFVGKRRFYRVFLSFFFTEFSRRSTLLRNGGHQNEIEWMGYRVYFIAAINGSFFWGKWLLPSFFFFKYFTEFLNGRPQSTPTNHNFHKWFHDAKKNGFHKSTLERERITFFLLNW